AAFAIRAMAKLPTGDKDIGNGTGKPDFSIDAILSKEAAKTVEVAAFAGFEGRGKPDNFDTPTTAFRWGAGVGFPSPNCLRVTGEVNGLASSDDSATTTLPLRGIDGSTSLLTAKTENITRATVGLTAQAPKGFFFGAGVSWNVPTKARDLRFSETPGKDTAGD